MHVAGAANGALTLSDCLHAGVAGAGAMAAVECGFPVASIMVPRGRMKPRALPPLWHVAGKPRKAFVDFQNDVTVTTSTLSDREGFKSVEHLKRYTTLGMATDQGKTRTCRLAVLAEASPAARSPRPAPRPIGRPMCRSLSAPRRPSSRPGLPPIRLTPSHAWAAEQGAVFVEPGCGCARSIIRAPARTDWLESVNREVTAVRGGVGVCDVSTLGKIDEGADAAAFLDRVYINTLLHIAVGKARYG
jgi:hypothetical protein